MEAPRILVVDDDAGTQRAILRVLAREPYTFDTAGSAFEALEILSQSDFDLVLTDVRMDRMSGIDLLRKIKSQWPRLPVIVMTAFAGVDTAVSSIHEGAFDYISKPYQIDDLRSAVRRAVEHTRLVQSDLGPAEAAGATESDTGIIGTSPVMVEVYKKIALVARTETTVLVEGETGSGKELVARAIHRNSNRRAFPFVAVNCGAFTQSLLESELFGHVRGAFTGATAHKLGLFETANHGTVFLDEISETTPAMQTRLLRVLEEREIQRVGSMDRIPVDIRVVAASNRAVGGLVKEGSFREDLYYRLNVVTIRVPPLRERLSDIPLLFDGFLKRHGGKRATPLAVHPDVLDMLAAHDWPGNVRELENAVERTIALNNTGILTPSDFTGDFKREARQTAIFPDPLVPLHEVQRRYVEHVVRTLDGNMSRAAEVLEIDRRTLYRMLDRFQAQNPDESFEPGN